MQTNLATIFCSKISTISYSSYPFFRPFEAKQEAFEKILPVLQKELGDVYMDNLAWMKALKKDPIHKKIMPTRDEYVNNNMFDPDEAIAAAVKKRRFLLKRLLEDQRRFPEQ